MVCSTVLWLSGIPEFHEFHPIGGVRGVATSGAGVEVHAATRTRQPRIDDRRRIAQD
jgi:hypothetical protein